MSYLQMVPTMPTKAKNKKGELNQIKKVNIQALLSLLYDA